MPEPTIRMARRSDLEPIVALLADDPLGARRERFQTPLPEGYGRAFDAIDADPNHELAVLEIEGEVSGVLQLTTDKTRPEALRFYEALGFRVSHEGLKLDLAAGGSTSIEKEQP